MTLKIQGSSIRKEFVKCFWCEKEFVWLNAYEMYNGFYQTVCAKCMKDKMFIKKLINKGAKR